MKTVAFATAVAMLLASTPYSAVEGRQTYQTDIPNGANVPGHAGVGHTAVAGGGERNQFGKDFAAQGHSWTTTLCNMDSDNDGYSNGVELNDPDCRWTKGGTFNPSTIGVRDPSLASSIPATPAPVHVGPLTPQFTGETGTWSVSGGKASFSYKYYNMGAGADIIEATFSTNKDDMWVGWGPSSSRMTGRHMIVHVRSNGQGPSAVVWNTPGATGRGTRVTTTGTRRQIQSIQHHAGGGYTMVVRFLASNLNLNAANAKDTDRYILAAGPMDLTVSPWSPMQHGVADRTSMTFNLANGISGAAGTTIGAAVACVLAALVAM